MRTLAAAPLVVLLSCSGGSGPGDAGAASGASGPTGAKSGGAGTPADAGPDGGLPAASSCTPLTAPDPDGGIDVVIVSGAEFGSSAPQDFTVCLPPGPFAQAFLRYQAVGGSGADCAIPAGWYSGICSPSGDHVDRVISNGIVLPPEQGDAGMADGGFYLELNRGVTTYGGTTAYEQDISFAAPLLSGETTFRLLLENGCTKGGWEVSASVRLVPGPSSSSAFSRAAPAFTLQRIADDPSAQGSGAQAWVDLPAAFPSARLLVFATGHNNQGTGCEEFCPGHAISFAVDGADAGTVKPSLGQGDPSCVGCCDGCGGPGGCAANAGWCGQEQQRGACGGATMSCDAASGCCGASGVGREGWCPGKPAPAYLFPVGDLEAGRHAVHFVAPGSATAGGYWLISAAVVAP